MRAGSSTHAVTHEALLAPWARVIDPHLLVDKNCCSGMSCLLSVGCPGIGPNLRLNGGLGPLAGTGEGGLKLSNSDKPEED